MARLRIVSGGTGASTQILVDDKPLQGVSRVEILPITRDDAVRAVLTFEVVELDVDAEAELGLRGG